MQQAVSVVSHAQSILAEPVGPESTWTYLEEILDIPQDNARLVLENLATRTDAEVVDIAFDVLRRGAAHPWLQELDVTGAVPLHSSAGTLLTLLWLANSRFCPRDPEAYPGILDALVQSVETNFIGFANYTVYGKAFRQLGGLELMRTRQMIVTDPALVYHYACMSDQALA